MVSLGTDSRRQGGYFFDGQDGITQQDSEERLVGGSHTTLGTDDDPGFRRIRSVWVIVTMLLIMVALEVSIFVFPAVCGTDKCHVNPYSIIIYIHSLIWVFLMLADRYLRYLHYFSRADGYLNFYRRTRNIRRVPLMVYSGGTAMLTAIVALLADHCPTSSLPCPSVYTSRLFYIQLLITLEMVIILPVLVTYLVWTVRFNRLKASPDVQQEELLSSTFQNRNVQTHDVGFRDEDYVDEVLEKQADLIRYLRQHNANLGRKILKLTAELQQNQAD